MLLKNSVAILTGAGREKSIGAAIARLLAREGCNLLINCVRSSDQAEKVAAECRQQGVDAHVFVGDLTDAAVCQQMADKANSIWGRADIVINCLGNTKAVPYEQLNLLHREDFDKIFAVNVFAPFFVAQAFQALLKKSGNGVLINISSVSGITGEASSIAYAAAKGAENTLTLALAQALSPEIRVNAVCPSSVDSSWWEEVYAGKDSEYQAFINSLQESNLLGRILKPNDVAVTVMNVISNPAISGELIRVDAGEHVGKANFRKQP